MSRIIYFKCFNCNSEFLQLVVKETIYKCKCGEHYKLEPLNKHNLKLVNFNYLKGSTVAWI